MNCLVSVIIPCYNSEKYLLECVTSVLSQSYKNIECIIVDDGSTDNTKNIALSIANSDKRVRYLSKKNGGIASARNYGILHSRGNWIQLLDSDDLLNHDKIKYQLSFFNISSQHTSNIVFYSDYKVFWTDDRNKIIKCVTNIIGNLNSKELLAKYMSGGFTPDAVLSCNTVLINKSVFAHRHFNERLNMFEDMAFLIDLLVSDTLFIYTPIVGMKYRLHQSNTTKNHSAVRHSYIPMLHEIYKLDKALLSMTPHIGWLAKASIKDKDCLLISQINELILQTQEKYDFSNINFSLINIHNLSNNIEMLSKTLEFIRITKCNVFLIKNSINISSPIILAQKLKLLNFLFRCLSVLKFVLKLALHKS